jgi:DNA-directed RNA polymerase subunit RPC12/RpoP
MSDDIVKTLLESLSDEQKAQLVQGLLGSVQKDEPVSKKNEEVVPSESEETVSSESKEDQNDFTMHKNNSKPKGRREPVKFKKNAWQDDGLEFSDMDTPKIKRTPRNRKKSQKVSVECHVCGKEFQVNANLVYGEYHRCNRCGGK